jgi:AbrB family looped-hinge helix DNA binding protein
MSFPLKIAYAGKMPYNTNMATQEAQARVTANGRMVIPASFRRALGVKSGDTLILRLEDNELRITTFRQRLAKAQELVSKLNIKSKSLADELIAERRKEARRE